MAERFSKRLGLSQEEETEITIREDAPQHVREAILIVAEHDLDLSPSTIRSVLCNTLRKIPDSNNWSQYPNICGYSDQFGHSLQSIEATYSGAFRPGVVGAKRRWAFCLNLKHQ